MPTSERAVFRPIAPGIRWEYRIARLRFYQGHLVRRSVDLWPQTDGRKLAEIDALVVSFDPQLRPHVEVVECKTRARASGEIDRVFWLAGLARFVGSNSALLAKLQVDARSRQTARRLHVDALDSAAVSAGELAAGVPDDGWIGFHDPDFGERVVKPLRERLTSSEPLRRAGRFLWGSYWTADPFVAVKQIRTLVNLVTSNIGKLEEPMTTLALGEATTLLARAAFEITGWRNQYDDHEYGQFVRAELTAGIADAASLRPLLRRIDQMQHAQLEALHLRYTESGAARLAVAAPSLEATMLAPPEWVEGLLDLSDRLRSYAPVATDVLRLLDLRAAWRLGAHSGLPASLEALASREVTDAARLMEDFIVAVWDTPKRLFDLPPTVLLPTTTTAEASTQAAHDTPATAARFGSGEQLTLREGTPPPST